MVSRGSGEVRSGDHEGDPGLGILLASPPTRWTDAQAAASDLAALERSGCDGLWFVDHLFWGAPVLEALTMCAAAATSTSRCLIGPAVLQLPLRRPAAVAKAAATLQILSGGRFVLGVGVGEHEAEYERVGADFGHRGIELDAAIGELRGLWSVEVDQFAQRPVPATVPIWVGGRSEAAMRRAANLGDGWMPTFVTVDAYRNGLARVRSLANGLGRSDEVVSAVVVPTAVTSRGWTRGDALGWFGSLYGIDPAPLDQYLVSGTAQECAALLSAYAGAGAVHVIAFLATDEPVEPFGHLRTSFAAIAGSASADMVRP